MREGPAWLLRLDDPGDGPAVAVKDAIDVEGTVTTVGSPAIVEEGVPAPRDAACVRSVRRGGGRIVGKTNLTELCWFTDGVNDFTGTPVNPVDAGRVPGGSSSGSAVCVARGEADLALGTDTGGSVRIPAACCGVAGLKTTRGLVPLDGVFPLAPGLDTVGPLARDVSGLVVAMDLLLPRLEAGRAPPERGPGRRNGAEEAAGTPRRARRVVRLRLGADQPVEPHIDEAVDAALDRTGWAVEELAVPGWDVLARESGRVLDAEAGVAHRFLLQRPELLSPLARDYIERGGRQRPERVAEARRILEDLGQRLGAALVGADALVLPTLAVEPPPVESLSHDLDGGSAELSLTRLTVPFNVLGWPAVSAPAEAPAPGGRIPASVQLVGPPMSDRHLLDLAAALPSQTPR